VVTYGGTYPNGGYSHGGYAKFHRGPAEYAFKLPEGLSSEEAGPMMCGGITMFAPLKNNGCGPGKRVGIVGVG
jgi:D-arabinose 1-dehydrogenase-like Zn-dependent alcohol dehydrogenase